MSKKTDRTHTVTSRMSPEIVEAAQKVAKVTGRTVSGLCEYALRRYIECNHPEAFDKSAKVVITTDSVSP